MSYVDWTVPEIRYKPKLLDHDEDHAVKYSVHWVREHGPGKVSQMTLAKQCMILVDLPSQGVMKDHWNREAVMNSIHLA